MFSFLLSYRLNIFRDFKILFYFPLLFLSLFRTKYNYSLNILQWSSASLKLRESDIMMLYMFQDGTAPLQNLETIFIQFLIKA